MRKCFKHQNNTIKSYMSLRTHIVCLFQLFHHNIYNRQYNLLSSSSLYHSSIINHLRNKENLYLDEEKPIQRIDGF